MLTKDFYPLAPPLDARSRTAPAGGRDWPRCCRNEQFSCRRAQCCRPQTLDKVVSPARWPRQRAHRHSRHAARGAQPFNLVSAMSSWPNGRSRFRLGARAANISTIGAGEAKPSGLRPRHQIRDSTGWHGRRTGSRRILEDLQYTEKASSRSLAAARKLHAATVSGCLRILQIREKRSCRLMAIPSNLEIGSVVSRPWTVLPSACADS